VSPRAGLDAVGFNSAGTRCPVVQLVARRHTDRAMPAPYPCTVILRNVEIRMSRKIQTQSGVASCSFRMDTLKPIGDFILSFRNVNRNLNFIMCLFTRCNILNQPPSPLSFVSITSLSALVNYSLHLLRRNT
jgi:hypothetical protein